MRSSPRSAPPQPSLREQVEAASGADKVDLSRMSAGDLQQLVEALQSRVIELERENEALRQARLEPASPPPPVNRCQLSALAERTMANETWRESEWRQQCPPQSVLPSEGNPSQLDLAALIDVPALQKLMDDFYAVTRIPMSVLDIQGRGLVGVGWQEICTRFHRGHPVTGRHCVESDTQLSAGLAPGECRLYKCKNHMWDMATPITVTGQHLGNIFTGQFFFEDEPVDPEAFRAQARRFGFDEEQYLAALDRVPRLSRETVQRGMAFFLKLAEMLSQLGHSNLKLTRLLVERERLTESLRQSEERFHRMFEHHQAIMLVIEPESGAIVDANRAAATFYGFSCEQLRQMCIEQINQLPPQEVAGERQKAVEEQRNYFVFPHRLANGQIRWVEVYSTPLVAGGRTLLFSIIHDITSRREAEEALRQGREDLDRALEVGQMGWWRLDTRRNVLTWSEQNYRTFNIPPGTPLSYEAFLGTVHPNDRAYVDAQWTAALYGHPYDIEHRIVVAGEVKWVREKAYLEFDAAGHLLGGFGITQDITQRKQAEAALRASEEQLRLQAAALEAAANAIAIVNRHGTIEWVNESFTRLTGYQAAEAVGQNPRVLKSGQHPPEFYRQIWETVLTGEVWHGELINKRKDGSFFTEEMTITPVRDRAAGITHFVAIKQDITRRKQAEAALKTSKHRMALLATVAERLLRTSDPQGVVEDLCQQVMGHLDCQVFFNYLVAAPGQQLHLNACAGIPAEAAAAIQHLEFGTAICGCVARDGERLLATDIQHSTKAQTELVKSFGVQAYCCHPLLAQEQVLGTLSFGTRTRPAFTADEVALMKSVADQVAVAMQRVRAEQALRLARDELELRVQERTVDLQKAVANLQEEIRVRAQVEKALRASEERYRTLFEASPIGIGITTFEGRVIAMNRSLSRILAVEPQALPNIRTPAFYVDPSERSRLVEEVQRGGCVRERELRVRRADDTQLIGLIQVDRIHIDEHPFLLVMIEDITERKLLEKQVLEILEKERQRVGQDLHDSLGGMLAGAALMGKALAKTLAAAARPEAALAEEIVRCLNDSMSQTRAIARGLCPVHLSGAGLVSALTELARETCRRSSVDCRFTYEPDIQVPDVLIAAHLFRIVQEAVNNAIRHGRPRQVQIRLNRREALLSLEVQDDGVGLPADQTVKPGLGLRTMTYRAGVLGGRLTVKRGETNGTVISCLVPLNSFSTAGADK